MKPRTRSKKPRASPPSELLTLREQYEQSIKQSVHLYFRLRELETKCGYKVDYRKLITHYGIETQSLWLGFLFCFLLIAGSPPWPR